MEVFECQMCGSCCEGRGGIVLEEGETERLAAILDLAPAQFVAEYCENSAGKLKLGIGKDGYCVFFEHGKGCAVHDVKPGICRAWPFFRGNLADEYSMAMAAEFCQGINREASFSDFQRQGLAYLSASGLLGSQKKATALNLPAGLLALLEQE